MGYKYLNLNPKNRKVGDCSIRAVAAALLIHWDDAYRLLAEAGMKLKCSMEDVKAVNEVMINHGFIVGKIKVDKGEHRPTVESFSEQHPNYICVLRVANHITACAMGNYVDIWDCGDKSVYKYWYKQIK